MLTISGLVQSLLQAGQLVIGRGYAWLGPGIAHRIAGEINHLVISHPLRSRSRRSMVMDSPPSPLNSMEALDEFERRVTFELTICMTVSFAERKTRELAAGCN